MILSSLDSNLLTGSLGLDGNTLAATFESIKTVFSNKNVMAATLTQSIAMFAMFLWRPFWGLYVLELGGTKSSIGLLTTVQSLTTLMVQLPGGMISDRFGRKRVIMVSSVLGLLPPLIYWYSSNWTTLIIGAVLASTTSLGMPALNALIADSLPKKNRATGFGAYTMFWYLAIVAAIPIGGYMLEQLGVVPGTRWGLLVAAALTIPIVLIRWRYIEETVDMKPDNPAEPKRLSFSMIKGVSGDIWKLILVSILSSFSFQVFWSYVVVYSVEEVGLSMMQWSYVSMISNFIAACFMVPSGLLSDRVGRKRLIILSQLGVSFASLGYVLSSNYLGIAGTRVLGSRGEGLGGNVMGSIGGPVWQTLVTEVAPVETRGSILGLMGTVTGLITTPAPVLGGYLYDVFSPQAPFMLSFIVGIIGCIIFFFWVKEPKREDG
jgi:MFS family permease